MKYFRYELNFFIIALISNIIKAQSQLKFKYPTSITLSNKNIFVIEENGIFICSQDFTTIREDTCDEKRVELHAHTKMSDMDGVTDVGALVKRAIKWGHKAVAITDHGVVQAFPDAEHAIEGDFKVIYGLEAYLVDDLKEIVSNSDNRNIKDKYVVFDIETTGFSPVKDMIIEIGFF